MAESLVWAPSWTARSPTKLVPVESQKRNTTRMLFPAATGSENLYANEKVMGLAPPAAGPSGKGKQRQSAAFPLPATELLSTKAQAPWAGSLKS